MSLDSQIDVRVAAPEPKSWEHMRAVVLHRDGYVCQLCQMDEATTVDHIWPRSKGGPDTLANLQAACAPCNRSKGDAIDIRSTTLEQARWLKRSRIGRLDAARKAAREAETYLDLLERAYPDAANLGEAVDRWCADNPDPAGPTIAETAAAMAMDMFFGGML